MKDNNIACEVPTSKDYKIKPKLAAPISSAETKTSKFCGEYKKLTKPSEFEFPCYLKCDSHIGKFSKESFGEGRMGFVLIRLLRQDDNQFFTKIWNISKNLLKLLRD